MKRWMKKTVSIILVLFLAVTLLAPPMLAQARQSAFPADFDTTILRKQWREHRAEQLKDVSGSLNSTPYMDKAVRIMIELKAPAAVDTGRSEKSVIASQQSIREQVLKITGTELLNSYGYLANGFSLTAKRSDFQEIRAIPGVKNVAEVPMFYMDMKNAAQMTHAVQVWEDLGIKGEGMLVSIIDTGIDPSHKDMRLSDGTTAKLTSSDVTALISANSLQGKFFTEKIPYGYNYADKNQNIVDEALSGQPGSIGDVSMHGMHVAGITAANATDQDLADSDGIRGMAPEAQLLAMKVFSNDQSGGAWADDILMAIQDSVKLGADIINMSLGSPSGFSDADNAFSRGVAQATDAGTLLVMSAGNEGLAYDSSGSTSNELDWLDKYFGGPGMPDSGSVGAYSTLPDALSVASVDNTATYSNHMVYRADEGTPVEFSYDSQKEPAGGRTFLDGHWIEIVDCGLGQEDDLDGIDLTVKYAFVQRGIISFQEKAENAAAAGAIGILIWDNRPTTGSLGMSGIEDSGISSVFLWEAIGLEIQALLDDNKTVEVDTESFLAWTAPTESAPPSYFTSWGPSPELNFKPEVAGVGGSVYSTFNGSTYGMMSGTSMSSPHVAGATALIMAAMAKDPVLKELAGRARINYVKAILSNTASPLIDVDNDEAIHSPRQVGAGLINVKDAIDSNVTVTYNGQGNVALKDFEGTKTFILTFTNYGDQEVTFQAQEAVVFSTEHDGDAYDYVVDDASVTFSTTDIVVPASGEVTVECVLDPGSTEYNYVEGYLEFKSSDASVPSLSIPYMGYVGDWAELNIFDFVEGLGPDALGRGGLYDCYMPAIDDDAPWLARVFSATQLYRYDTPVGVEVPGGNWYDWILVEDYFNPWTVGFNNDPDEEDSIKELAPRIGVFRGVQEVECFITDEGGNELRQVGWIDAIRKPVMSRLTELRSAIDMAYGTHWDGTLYDASTGEFTYAEEGQYIYKVRARMNDQAEWQTIEIPVKVDNTPPTLTSSYDDFYGFDAVYYDEVDHPNMVLTFTDVLDGLGTGIDSSNSGVAYFDPHTGDLVFPDQSWDLDDDGNLEIKADNPDYLFGSSEAIGLLILNDYTENMTVQMLYIMPGNWPTAAVRAYKLGSTVGFDDVVGPNPFITYNAKECEDFEIAEGTAEMMVRSYGPVVTTTVNGGVADVDEDEGISFHILSGMVDGVPVDLEIKGFADDDTELASAQAKLLVDRTAPVMVMAEVLAANTQGLNYVEMTDEVNLTVSDNFAAGINRVVGFDGVRQFSLAADDLGMVTVPVFDEGQLITITPVDFVGNFGTPISFFLLPDGVEPDDLTIPDPETDEPEPWLDVTTSGLEGLFDNGYAFVHMDVEADTHELVLKGEHENVSLLFIDDVPVTLDSGGEWTHTLTLREGTNYVNVNAFDLQDDEFINTKIRLYCDSRVPNLVFETDPDSVDGEFVFPAGTPDPDELIGNQPPLVIWTNKSEVDVNITGTASDNTFGYKLAINGDVILDYYDLEGEGPEINERPFERLIEAVKPNEFIRLVIEDLADFESPDYLLQKIQLRGDTIAPTLTPFYDKQVDADPPIELLDAMVFDVEDAIVLSAEAEDEDGGSGLAGNPTIMVNGVLYDGEPLAAGIYGVVFRVSDRAGNETIVVRSMIVLGDAELNVGDAKDIYAEDVDTFDPLEGVTATDPVEGDLTDQVTAACDLPEAFAAGIPGTYTFTYTVTNAAGRTTTATKTVRILGRPQLFGVSDKTITEKDAFDPMAGITAYDNEDGDLTDEIIIEGVVDVTKPGVYTLTYHVYDSHGNKAVATRMVTVETIKYTITFDSKGGSVVAAITQEAGTAINKPADPTREGYTFNGWIPDLPATMPAKNMTLEAKWSLKPVAPDPTEPGEPVVPTGESMSGLIYVGVFFIAGAILLIAYAQVARKREDFS